MARASSKARIATFLLANMGRNVSAQEIQAAAGPVTEWARRVRELRKDEGWPIVTHNDDGSLKPGEYRLTGEPPAPGEYRFARPISARLRAQVLERNGYTCQMCGAGAGEPDASNPGRRVRLHIGHIIDRDHGGEDELANLRALCSTCNQGAQNIVQEPPSRTWLRAQVRRAREDDQRAILDMLKRKFGEAP